MSEQTSGPSSAGAGGANEAPRWTDDEREERWVEVAAEQDPEPTVEDDLDLAIALLHNRPDPHGDLRDDAYARQAAAWTDQFDLLMGRYRRMKAGDPGRRHEKDCCRTLRYERGHAEGCPTATDRPARSDSDRSREAGR